MSEVWRIFVVEGEEAFNRSLVNSLRKDGYIVQGVTNGADAVRSLWSEEYDVVICDLKTPGADGLELLQWLRASRPNTHIIIVGTADTAHLRMQVLESGAASYLEKPLDFRVLKEELRRLLQQTGFSASLDSFDLLDVIQIITLSRKSIALLVNTGLEERGMLRFQNGELVWAEYGVLRGEEAFFALAAHKNGTVIHQPWNEQGTSNVTQPLSRLIFQALQYRTKYADRQQYSGELDPVSDTPFATANGDDRLFANEEIDDSPFTVLQEMEPVSQAAPIEIAQDEPLQVATSFELPPVYSSDDGKEWWEQTGKSPRVPTTTDDAAMAPTATFGQDILQKEIEKVIAAQGQPAATVQNNALPSWLTDQPTTDMPALHSSSLTFSAQMPTVSGTKPSSSPEWPSSSLSTVQTPEQLNAKQPTPVLPPLVEEAPVAPLPIAPTWSSGEQVGYAGLAQDIQSMSPAKMPGGAWSFDEMQDSNALLSSTAQSAAQRGTRRNYTALISALQTLGYSITGFIAAAVVNIEGYPIAQVAVDDLDISKLCKHFSTIQKHVLQALEQGMWGDYEDTIITSAGSHILMRVVGTEKKAFQVLITTRDANPVESLEVMANVEGAISAALR